MNPFTGASVADLASFGAFATIAVLGALGTVLMRKAVHSAMCLALTMIVLALSYIALDALFLGVVQIVVYTGAVMMLFLFVLMLIGIDSSQAVSEVLHGQRLSAGLVATGFTLIVGGAIANSRMDVSPTDTAVTIPDLAKALFVQYVWAFELTGALLVTATLAAMVLAHRERLVERPTQRERSESRFTDGGHITPLPPSGVYARDNALDLPARLPDGSLAENSVSPVLPKRLPPTQGGR